ncbi:MAG: hypothetical protein IPM24_23380 [Bryobacterales bacterium]|nr:hypothetical protein [Bryobacterales bacterium]
MSRHPSEAQLALWAGGELNWVSRFRVGRHLKACDRCMALADEFTAARDQARELQSLPDGMSEAEWQRLAMDMEANIRLGLAAGACVALPAPHVRPRRRLALAYAALAALAAVGIWSIHNPAPQELAPAPSVSVVEDGIAVHAGSLTLGLLHEPGAEVEYSANAWGSVAARYVDADSGMVTIQNVALE